MCAVLYKKSVFVSSFVMPFQVLFDFPPAIKVAIGPYST
jgi:hypothetical protein